MIDFSYKDYGETILPPLDPGYVLCPDGNGGWVRVDQEDFQDFQISFQPEMMEPGESYPTWSEYQEEPPPFPETQEEMGGFWGWIDRHLNVQVHIPMEGEDEYTPGMQVPLDSVDGEWSE